jgi:hypothetical protein
MLFSLIWFLCAFSGPAVASVLVGPYETFFYYYAYRAEGLSVSDSNIRKIGKRCVPSTPSPDGLCDFQDFVRHIGLGTGKNKATPQNFNVPAGAIGNLRLPKTDEIANMGTWGYNFVLQPRHLHDGLPWHGTKALRPGDTYPIVTDILQDARKNKGSAVETELRRAVEAMQRVHVYRLEDNARAMIEDVESRQGWNIGKGNAPTKDRVKGWELGSKSFKVLDMRGLLNRGINGAAIRAFMVDFEAKQTTVRHLENIRYAQSSVSRLNGPRPC